MSPGQYIPKIDRYLSRVGLGVTLWEGVYENRHDLWLRWCDADKNLIPTGRERAEQAEAYAEKASYDAEQAKSEADKARQEAEQARQISEKLAEKLRALGIDPDA